MNKEEIDAQLALSRLNNETALEKEFEKLAPSLLRAFSGVACLFFIVWMFPEIIEQPIS